jgi:hypothetical protein
MVTKFYPMGCEEKPAGNPIVVVLVLVLLHNTFHSHKQFTEYIAEFSSPKHVSIWLSPSLLSVLAMQQDGLMTAHYVEI